VAAGCVSFSPPPQFFEEFSMRKLILAVSALALAVPAAPAASFASGPQQAQTWQGSDGRTYCKRRNGTTGLLVGGAAGILAGRAVDRSASRATGSVLGGAIGALLGRQVERQMKARCR
jgi:hypothetical protein